MYFHISSNLRRVYAFYLFFLFLNSNPKSINAWWVLTFPQTILFFSFFRKLRTSWVSILSKKEWGSWNLELKSVLFTIIPRPFDIINSSLKLKSIIHNICQTSSTTNFLFSLSLLPSPINNFWLDFASHWGFEKTIKYLLFWRTQITFYWDRHLAHPIFISRNYDPFYRFHQRKRNEHVLCSQAPCQPILILLKKGQPPNGGFCIMQNAIRCTARWFFSPNFKSTINPKLLFSIKSNIHQKELESHHRFNNMCIFFQLFPIKTSTDLTIYGNDILGLLVWRYMVKLWRGVIDETNFYGCGDYNVIWQKFIKYMLCHVYQN